MRLDRLAVTASLVAGYAASVLFSVVMSRVGGQGATLWTATGFLAAVLILLPGAWRIAGAGACVASQTVIALLAGDGVFRAALYPLVNLFEAAIAAWLALRFCGAGARRLSLRRLMQLIVAAIAPAAMAGGALGAAVNAALSGRDLLQGWAAWTLPGGLGMAIVLPALLLIARAGQYPEFQRTPLEIVALFAGLFGLSAAVFLERDLPLQFLVFPACALIAVRLGPAGAAVAGFVVAMVALPLAMLGHGPVATAAIGAAARVGLTETIVASALFTSLTTAAALADQSRLRRLMLGRDKALRAARARARRAESLLGETEARRLSSARRKGVADFA
jgi:integral membrane sensor domain MASE1